MNKELDLTKPLRIRRSSGSYIEGAVFIGEASESATPLIVWVPKSKDQLEMTFQFHRDGTVDWSAIRLENVPPEPKVTEAPVWMCDDGTVYAHSDRDAVIPKTGWRQIGTLRITGLDGEPIKVEVV